MQVITSLEALEAKIQECNRVLADESDDAMRQLFQEFRMDFSAQQPPDPFSPEYRDFQLKLYEHIAGKRYSIHNERTLFDISAYIERPFPWYLQSPGTAGTHLMAIGMMLRTLQLPPGARIVEFGPGWGTTTIALAMLGYRVTAVDVEPNFCEVIRRRAAQSHVEIDVVGADFFWAESVREPFDAAIFFECFHHCDDHMRLLRALHTAVKPEGQVVFASEPVLPGYPIPWGVRMDGESLWAMKNFGWLELGYDEAYFQEALTRTGWKGTKHPCVDPFWANVWIARSAEDHDGMATTTNIGGDVAVEAPAGPALAEELPDPEAAPAQPPAPDIEASSAAETLARELESVYRSTSWRMTAPIRTLKRLLTR